MSIYSMFALYPRSGYYSDASFEVRSVALLNTFFTLLSSTSPVLRLGEGTVKVVVVFVSFSTRYRLVIVLAHLRK